MYREFPHGGGGWGETMAYLGDRYPELPEPALGVLRGRAERFITGPP